MRSPVGTGLALLAIAHGGGVYADPSTPQISPVHGRREDAQRLTEQLRGLGRAPPPEPVPVAPQPQVILEHRPRPGLTLAGVVLLSLAAVTGLTAIALGSSSSSSSADASSRDQMATAFAVTAAVTGVAGLVVVLENRAAPVAPTAAPRAVGLAVLGHF